MRTSSGVSIRSPSDGRLPSGLRTLRGVPFRFARAGAGRRWLLLDREVDVDLRAVGPASHLVIAHFCDAWRDPLDGRPDDLPVGWVMPPGQPLARYVLETARGGSVEHVIRRRFEINEGIVGWGQGAFAAVPHMVASPLDWRGPHPVPPPGGYAEPGHAGLRHPARQLGPGPDRVVIWCPARPATSRCGCTRSRSREAPAISCVCGWSH
jgi:hypothetical protein